MCDEEKGTANLQMNKTYFIISKSFGSETLIFRAMFHERWTMGTMDFTLCSLFHSYRSTANLYWQAAQTHSYSSNQSAEGTIINQDHSVCNSNLYLLQLNFIHNEPFIPTTFPFFKMSFFFLSVFMMLKEHTIIPRQQQIPAKTSYWHVFDLFVEHGAVFQKWIISTFSNILD